MAAFAEIVGLERSKLGFLWSRFRRFCWSGRFLRLHGRGGGLLRFCRRRSRFLRFRGRGGGLLSRFRGRGGLPGFFNDEVTMPLLLNLRQGITLEEARSWAVVGCCEPVIPGKFNTITGGVCHINLLKVLEIFA